MNKLQIQTKINELNQAADAAADRAHAWEKEGFMVKAAKQWWAIESMESRIENLKTQMDLLSC